MRAKSICRIGHARCAASIRPLLTLGGALIYAAKRPSVEFVVPPTEYRVLLPQVDGYVKLTEEEARDLYEALGRLLPPPIQEMNIDGMRPLDA